MGRGITNSRSNYDVACQVALGEALINARFSLMRGRADRARARRRRARRRCARRSSAASARSSTASQLRVLRASIERLAGSAARAAAARAPAPSTRIADADGRGDAGALSPRARAARATSSATWPAAATCSWPRPRRANAGRRLRQCSSGLFDKAILDVENSAEAAGRFEDHMRARPWPKLARRADETLARGRARGRVDTRARADRRASAPATAAQRLPFPEGADPLRDPLPRPAARTRCSRARAPCSTSAARTPRPSRSTTQGIVTSLPDERPLRRRLRPLPRLHRRRDEPRPARARAAGLRVDARRCASTRPARCSPAPSCASGCRSARSARTSSPACTAPSSCARCRCSRARAACSDEFTFTGGVAKNPAAVGALRKLVARELRRASPSTSPPTPSTPARSARRCSRCATHAPPRTSDAH